MPDLPPPDRLAFDRAMVATPVWNRLERAHDAINLPPDVLLHAGPPFKGPGDIPVPVLNSACAALEFEGMASDHQSARNMIMSGDIRLEPAQDRQVATPLAAVVSTSMVLHAVYDSHRGMTTAYAPLNGGSGPAARLGQYSQEAVDHLRWLNDAYAETLQRGIAEGISVLEIAAESMRNGDDCHGRTPYASRLLKEAINERTPGGIRDARITEFMDSSPSIFLNLWMAAIRCILDLANGTNGSGMVTAAGGNGVEFGIKIADLPDRWFTTDAAPPRGALDPGTPTGRSLGAIGDSAIIDIFGLGAMAFHLSPEQLRVLGPYLPGDINLRRQQVTIDQHIGFRNSRLCFGLSASLAAKTGMSPVISLGILDSQGDLGRLGGGIYEVPQHLFHSAIQHLA